jgi:Tol biopolymer transport system component
MKNIFFSFLLVLILASSSFSQAIDKIVYVSTENPTGLLQVFIMDGSGSNKRQITNMTTNCLRPELSADGKKIVFQTDDYRIFYIDDIDGTNLEPYFVFGGSNPSFTNDGNEIIFNSDHEYISSIYVMEPTAPDANLLAMDGYCNQQELSPDGSKILFSGFLGGTKQIFLADLDDTTDNYLSQVSDNDDSNLEPDMNSDGSKIVYAGFNQALQGSIYINKNGQESKLTRGISCNQPKLSPDGNTIAFVVIEGTNVNLHVMKDDGSSMTKVRVSNGSIGTFEWVDNETIIYDAGDGDRYSIGTVNVFTGDSKTLATGGINIHPFFIK